MYKRLTCVKGAGPKGLRDCCLLSKKHAETHLQEQIAILRMDCGTAANRMHLHSGKTEKKTEEKACCFLSRPFLIVFIVPVALFFVS